MKRNVSFEAVMIATLSAAIVLRFRRLGEVSLWLDEIINFDLATASLNRPWYSWIAGFERENGPLYYAGLLAGRFVETPEVSSRIVPAILGALTVFVIAAAGSAAFDDRRVGAVAAILIAFSPLHVYYSREGRTYSALMFFAALAIYGLVARTGRWALAAAWISVVGAAYTASSSAPLLLSIIASSLLVYVLESSAAGTNRRSHLRQVAVIAAFGTALIALLYFRFPQVETSVDFPSDFLQVGRAILIAFSVAALDGASFRTASMLPALLALIGTILMLRRHPRTGAAVVGMFIFPLTGTLTALWIIEHWFSVRYVAVALPAYLLMVSHGVVALATTVGKLLPARWAALATHALIAASVLGIGSIGFRAALDEPFEKLPWKDVARLVTGHAKPGDSILVSNHWSAICLEFYQRALAPRLRVLDAGESRSSADWLVGKYSPFMMLTAGYHGDPSVPEWLCSFPLLAADRREGFRLHSRSTIAGFLHDRGSAAEHSSLLAVSQARGERVEFDESDHQFLGPGWGGAERHEKTTFAWVEGRSATLYFPAGEQNPRVITFRAKTLLPDREPQQLSVTINDTVSRVGISGSDWRDYVVPAAGLRRGINRIDLAFEKVVRPVDLGQGSDTRSLSAAFDFISIGVAAPAVESLEPNATFRLPLPGTLGQAPSSPSDQQLRVPLESLPEKMRNSIRLRSGTAAMPATHGDEGRRIAGHLTVDSACSSDEAFVVRGFLVLYGRRPDPEGLAYYLRRLANGKTRESVISDLLRSPEFDPRATGGETRKRK